MRRPHRAAGRVRHRRNAGRDAGHDNERVRREGSTNVVDAALAAGVGRLVQESISFTYPSRGAEWIDESVEVDIPGGFDAVGGYKYRDPRIELDAPL